MHTSSRSSTNEKAPRQTEPPISLQRVDELMSSHPPDYRREAFTVSGPSSLRQSVPPENEPITVTFFQRIFGRGEFGGEPLLACDTIEKFQRLEYKMLRKAVYVDYGGAGQPMDSVVQRSASFLRGHVMGNTHSESPSARLSSDLGDRARSCIREFFCTTADKHEVIFTAGTSAALRLLADAYFNQVKADRIKTTLLLTDDSHNVVNGMRTIVHEKGLQGVVDVVFVPVDIVTLRLDESRFEEAIAALPLGQRGLVVLTAQSNLSGVKHPFGRLLRRAKDRGWDTALDAAAYLPTTLLNLSSHSKIDFLPCSWYKVLGYPTGIGSLVVRRDAITKLRKEHFSGGTVDYVHNGRWDQFRLFGDDEGGEWDMRRFEDGSLNFQSFVPLEMGLRRILDVNPTFREDVQQRVGVLSSWLLERLPVVRWTETGHPVVRIVGFPKPHAEHGGTIGMVFYDECGGKIPFAAVEREAVARNIHLRCGCICNYVARLGNPGDDGFPPEVGPDAISLVDWRYDSSAREWVLREAMTGEFSETGVVRISLGMPSRFEDVWEVWKLVKDIGEGKVRWK